MIQHPHLALPNKPERYIWSYYKLLLINPSVLAIAWVVVLQVLLVDKSFMINVYRACNLLIMHPALQSIFQYY